MRIKPDDILPKLKNRDWILHNYKDGVTKFTCTTADVVELKEDIPLLYALMEDYAKSKMLEVRCTLKTFRVKMREKEIPVQQKIFWEEVDNGAMLPLEGLYNKVSLSFFISFPRRSNMPGIEIVVGSRLYGLENETSDYDKMVIYFNREDYVRPFRYMVESEETGPNNDKRYSLDFFLKLVCSGNPNTTEVLPFFRDDAEYETQGNTTVHNLCHKTYNFIQENGVSYRVLHAYLGHLQGMISEMKKKEVTPKRLSHAYRVAYSLIETVETHKIVEFKNNPNRKKVYEVKFSPPSTENINGLKDLTDRCTELVGQHENDFPSAVDIKEFVNNLFIQEYSK